MLKYTLVDNSFRICPAPVATTTYTVTGTSAEGCISTDNVLVTVNPLPVVNAGPDQYFDIPGIVQLTGNNFGLPYYWHESEFLSNQNSCYRNRRRQSFYHRRLGRFCNAASKSDSGEK